YGTIAAYNVHSATSSHWASSSDIVFGHSVYIGFTALVLNVIVSVVLTLVFNALKVPAGTDETLAHQYTADPSELPVPAPAGVGLTAASE
ncbi:MAG TPA: hypothetical protein VMA73_20870, partial [Streptosporangiaceae bacterium]|nr:hypothetical protein [Streptosporangiaceae bacterium]